jgi:hypothetical protein
MECRSAARAASALMLGTRTSGHSARGGLLHRPGGPQVNVPGRGRRVGRAAAPRGEAAAATGVCDVLAQTLHGRALSKRTAAAAAHRSDSGRTRRRAAAAAQREACDRGLRRACDSRDERLAGTNADCRSHERRAPCRRPWPGLAAPPLVRLIPGAAVRASPLLGRQTSSRELAHPGTGCPRAKQALVGELAASFCGQ